MEDGSRKTEKFNDVGKGVTSENANPRTSPSVLLVMWRLFLKWSYRIKSSDVNWKGSGEDLDSSFYSDYFRRTEGTHRKW